jgi:hypothetical protein
LDSKRIRTLQPLITTIALNAEKERTSIVKLSGRLFIKSFLIRFKCVSPTWVKGDSMKNTDDTPRKPTQEELRDIFRNEGKK